MAASRRALKSLSDPDPAARAAAAETLGKLKHADAVTPLRAAVKDEDVRVRKAALIALGQIGDIGSIELAIEARGKADTREAAEAALRALGEPAEARLMAMLEDAKSPLIGSMGLAFRLRQV